MTSLFVVYQSCLIWLLPSGKMIHVSRSGDGGGSRSIAGESLRSHHQPSRQVRLHHRKSSKVDFYAADSPVGVLSTRSSFRRSLSTRQRQKTMAPDEVIDSQTDLENGSQQQQEKNSKRDTKKLVRSLWKYLKEAWTGVISGTGTHFLF